MAPFIHREKAHCMCRIGASGGAQTSSEQFGVEKDLMALPRIKPRFLDRPARGLAAVLTGLSWLLLNISYITI
jgi:hypothetical protein